MRIGELALGVVLGIMMFAAGLQYDKVSTLQNDVVANHTELEQSISITDDAVLEIVRSMNSRMVELNNKIEYLLEAEGGRDS